MSINLSKSSTWLAVLGSAALALGTQACGGGGKDNASAPTIASNGTGVFLDAPVAGIDYFGSAGSTGTTNDKGEFSYWLGEIIDFHIGGRDGLKLGQVQIGQVGATATDGKYYVTPLDLVQHEENASTANPKTIDLTDTRVKNMAYLLQALNAGTGTTLDLRGIDTAQLLKYKLLVNFASSLAFDGDGTLKSSFLDTVHKDKGNRATTALTVNNAVATMETHIKQRFNGNYYGTWNNTSTTKSGTWQFTITNGVLSGGTYAGGETGTFTGTISHMGVVTLTGDANSIITAGDTDLLRINHDGTVGCKVCKTTQMRGERELDYAGTWTMKATREGFGALKNINAAECGVLDQTIGVTIAKTESGGYTIQFANNRIGSQGTLTTTKKGFSFTLTGTTNDNNHWPFTWNGSATCVNDFTCFGEGSYTLDSTVSGTHYLCTTAQSDLYRRAY
ncbi:MAG: hypothetical protein HQL97_04255 [Magnetococcales bacterium]|nr:hypothetical protein [Magnetococcales bacterium]